MIKTIGIVGQGFVGTAVREGLRHSFKVCTLDKMKGKTIYQGDNEARLSSQENGIDWILAETEGLIFVCLPTPMNLDGSCDTSIVEMVIRDMDEAASVLGRQVVAAIKSTIPPGTTARLNAACRTLKVCFNPEFLREATYLDDFKNQDRIIVGGPTESVALVAQAYHQAFPMVPLILTDATTAEMVKYVTNAFLAVKVSFANEIRGLCGKLNIDFAEMIELAILDQRLGKSHWAVPGPDGKPGFGGSCFPKDLNALKSLAASLGTLHHTMQGAWMTNLAVRPERDWEKLLGRAVNYK